MRLEPISALAVLTVSGCALPQPRERTVAAWSSAEALCARWVDGRFYCTSAPDRRFGTPVPFTVPLPLVELSGSAWAGCGRDAAGEAYCWRHRQSWVGEREVLTLVVDSITARTGVRVTSVSASDDWACGTDAGGLGWCVAMTPGHEQSCVANARNTLCRVDPTRVAPNVRFARVQVGEAPHGSYGFACGLALDGRVYCWHRDGVFLFTESGNPELCRVPRLKLFNCTREPRPVHSSERFTSVSVGMGYACGITTSSQVLCWGYSGPLEVTAASQNCDYRSDFICTAVPSLVTGLPGAVAVDAGDLHACAITLERSAVCWGNGSMSQLGARSNTSSSFGDATLVTVQGNHRWSEITAGPFLTCGITLEREWYCWGQQPVDNPQYTGPQRIPEPPRPIPDA